MKARMASRKLLWGKGINDYDGPTKIKRDDGKIVHCPIYDRWRQILYRTTEKCWENAPYYKGTTICDDWLFFSKFREWTLTQNWERKQIDKDIIDPANKEYCPEKCRYVPREINVLLTERQNHRGSLPLGVTYDRSQPNNPYQAQCSLEGITSKKLGRFMNPTDAHKAYQKAKASEIIRVASLFYDRGEIDGDVYIALVMRANKVFDEYEWGIETTSIHHY